MTNTDGLRKAARRVFWEARQIDDAVRQTRQAVADEALQIVHMLDTCEYAARADGNHEWVIRRARRLALDDLLIGLRERQFSDEYVANEFDLYLAAARDVMEDGLAND
jgi:hypothetical protein